MIGLIRAALATALLTLPAVGASAAEAPGTLSAPLEVLRTGHIAVQVKVNDRGPFRLILDTGSPLTFISGRAAEKTGLVTADALKKPVFFGMRGQFTVKSLNVGDAQVKDLGLMVMDHPIIDLLSEVEGQIDGIVGYTFFSRFRTTLDYAAGRVTFTPVAYVPQDVTQSLMANMMRPQTGRRVVAPGALWGLVVEKTDEAPGVRVAQVYPGSAAAAAGLRAGDRLTVVDGRWTDSVMEMYDAASYVKPGETVAVRISRSGAEQELKIRVRQGL